MLIWRLRRGWFSIKEAIFLRRYRGRGERFAQIYRQRLWGSPESASGEGSTLEATGPTRVALARLIESHAIRSILDAPCGDFNWMSQVPFAGDYTGVDIVPELIAANAARFGAARRRFAVGDIVAEPLPEADLVLCRECLNHLPLADACAALERLAEAARKLLVVTHYPQVRFNPDQPASFRFRRLNLELAPFGLRPPDAVIDESHFSPGKVLAVWDMTTPLRP
jgi:SAM-dependent methyltransferase